MPIKRQASKSGRRSTRRNSINYGIKTGLNRAFIVDNETKEGLIREDPRSAELLKPLVRGRDVKAWRVDWNGLWLIATHNGYGAVPGVDVRTYPAIHRHLDSYRPSLERRQDQGETPYNLRSCAYHEDFAKPKITWIELAKDGRFALDEDGLFVEATAFMLKTSRREDLPWLCAVLNSGVASWWVRTTAPTSGAGATRWKKVYLETLPVPSPSPQVQSCAAALVQRAVQQPDLRACAQEALGPVIGAAYGLDPEELALLLASRSSDS